MKFRSFLVAGVSLICVGLTVFAADPLFARAKHKLPAQCIDRPYRFSLERLLFNFNTKPLPNGCAPPVFFNGDYIGQDPDPNIRFQLLRDPNTGYTVLR